MALPKIMYVVASRRRGAQLYTHGATLKEAISRAGIRAGEDFRYARIAVTYGPRSEWIEYRADRFGLRPAKRTKPAARRTAKGR
jgi:hypothetical protein